MFGGKVTLKVSDIYKTLTHYTTYSALEAILEHQTLRSTHYQFLNDYREIIEFENKLVELLLPTAKKEFERLLKEYKKAKEVIDSKGGFISVINKEASGFVASCYRALHGMYEGVYISSLCGETEDEYINNNGLLSQWRGYGKDGGYAIVFDTKLLEKNFQKELDAHDYSGSELIADIVYSGDEKILKEEFSKDIDSLSLYFSDMIDHLKNQKDYAPDADKAMPAFVACISRYKNQGFKEENEVRIVSLPNTHTEEYLKCGEELGMSPRPEKERKFFERGGVKVPCIDLFDGLGIKLPIKKIIVGPHRDKDARAASLRVLLRKKDIEVTVSEIPYIG